MSLDEYEQDDGRPVAFNRHDVSFMEPHDSGRGTMVVVGVDRNSRELHLKQDYTFLRGRFAESDMDRVMREAAEPGGFLHDRQAREIG